MDEHMDITTLSRNELLVICKSKGLRGINSKTKSQLIELLSEPIIIPTKISRLNYIGSKFQLLDWITTIIKDKTGYDTFNDKIFMDLFAGTGIVSHHFRNLGCCVISNDAELYSSIITHAFTKSIFTPLCNEILLQIQSELNENAHNEYVGFVTLNYSPYEENERKFFTIDNAKRIDYARNAIQTYYDIISIDEYNFILASLLISADAVSNVPAVYGCYLKNFKTKAIKSLQLLPIHTITIPSNKDSNTFCKDVITLIDDIKNIKSHIVYLDPPYNERQYSKNYFPLNIIAKSPIVLESEPPLKGKTGIPSDCFISSFCKKSTIKDAFTTLLKGLNTEWIFISYNSEGILSKTEMMEILSEYGEASFIERDYKRFKSFEYNENIKIKEYLFCLNNK